MFLSGAVRLRRTAPERAYATDALAGVLRQELQSEPGVLAATLWRWVQGRLREAGEEAPRSTFYRLLAQLRAEDAASGDGAST
jgi:hypothetical protein